METNFELKCKSGLETKNPDKHKELVQQCDEHNKNIKERISRLKVIYTNLGKMSMSKVRELVEFHPTASIICVSELYWEYDLIMDSTGWPDGYQLIPSEPSPVGRLSFSLIILISNIKVKSIIKGLHQNFAVNIELPGINITVACFYNFNNTKYDGYLTKFNTSEEVFFDDIEVISAHAEEAAIVGGDINMNCNDPRSGEKDKVERFGNILILSC